ncbi:WD40-repeat-containing domain-containing protein [Dioscorea alata]|uniref:WD40-repeat-containing domain-containing protein n=1 Tax=Dioscorea alata TaxID=55571 RepID=A0ACB7UUQ6_DIOAL|nr:WD40-repeat-containing domain-containing protein [Dioscorea alata]
MAMTNTGVVGDDEEEFYESLDRILSSSCSSTSVSDDDAGDLHRRRFRHHHFPWFPPSSAFSYDLWISEPSSVEERRRRLLQCMGLAGDVSGESGVVVESAVTSLPARVRDVEIARSVSCEGFMCHPHAAVARVERSRSDGCVDPGVHSGQPPVLPKSQLSKEVLEGDGDPRLTIKNLDDGREFVVREDGSWDKVREVGTGRQLTMDEFEMCVGRSPIVQELMRRQSGTSPSCNGCGISAGSSAASRSSGSARSKKRGSWLRSIKNVAGSVVTGGYYQRDRPSSDEKDTSSEKGGRRSSSATDDSQDGIHHFPERIRVRQYGKTQKELTAMCLSQEIQAHSGAIWCIKFSLDGRFLASAGEDCVIHVWQVTGYERNEALFLEEGTKENGNYKPFFASLTDELAEPTLELAGVEGSYWEKKRTKALSNRKYISSDHLVVPEKFFALGEKPVCSLKGHVADVLNLSWSKTQYLLSSSMDKTVRLWHLSSSSCLKTFSHSDYVTCIQFNPVDDRYFISGSLDEKVRIWSIPDRQVVDWNDLHEMVTAASYTPDGQAALVGTHRGSCHLYNTFDNKLQQKNQIDLQNKKRGYSHKKITGFQFAPGSSSEVLITSADSRIRVIDGAGLVHKFKGKNQFANFSWSSMNNYLYW